MKGIEEICYRFNRLEDEVERDLYAVLVEISGSHRAMIIDLDYKHALQLLLVEKRCILNSVIDYEITEEGRRILARGWIIRDYKSLNKKEKRDRLIKNWTLCATLITAFATLLTAILTIFNKP